MKKIGIVILCLAFFASALAARAEFSLDKLKKEGQRLYEGNSKGKLTNEEVIKGLKEALSIGSKNAAGLASKVDGYYKNPRIKIPFPPDAQKVKNFAEDVGLKNQVNKFVETLNRAAEEAAKEAAPIFLAAVKDMTISDGFKILKGKDNEATMYLKNKTTAPLTAKFRPVVKRAIQKVEVTKYWNPIITKYNQAPFVEKVNPDLDDYTTKKALQGLFILIADEERKIRKNPAARVTEILRRVFGS